MKQIAHALHDLGYRMNEWEIVADFQQELLSSKT